MRVHGAGHYVLVRALGGRLHISMLALDSKVKQSALTTGQDAGSHAVPRIPCQSWHVLLARPRVAQKHKFNVEKVDLRDPRLNR
ncbi:hypothetical protein NDU88_002987 [Pleurodeles waltl]|uniref:Uncharacterized protein n=1 Tax=Pleurodeles waltl TaxID=8319 RepID=A0AAV7T4T6_PLEWA|nr:hypothetical protein NDU88_002987 [Pleurodeles waltl]